jgi:hypothetical protein
MQAFRKGRPGRPANLDIVIVKIGVNDRLALVNVAEALGLGTCPVDAPWTSNKKPSPDRWILLDEMPSGSRCEKSRRGCKV